jgi:inner membrane protein
VSKTGHLITGVALGFILLHTTHDIAASAAVAAGALVPDAAEGVIGYPFGNRLSIIPHRTLTHWPYLYVAIALIAHRFAGSDALGISVGSIIFGLAVGALLHLALDVLSPCGVPLGNPFGARTSIGLRRPGNTPCLYKTGTISELPIIGALIGAAFIFSR